MGLAGIQEFEIEGSTELEITFRLLPQFWGFAYGSEAAGAAYRYAFEHIGADSVFSVIEPKNAHAISVAEANGLERISVSEIHGKDVAFYTLKRNQQSKLLDTVRDTFVVEHVLV